MTASARTGTARRPASARRHASGRRPVPGALRVVDARDLAASLIPRGSRRWRHSSSAAEAAAEAALVLSPDDGCLLVCTAWVHDIGYHHPDPPTGYHPLDGARLLLDAGWSPRMAALVAHHSEARFMADARGLRGTLDGWPRETGPVADALVWADMTAAPGGGRVGIRQRLADIRRRHAGEAPGRAAARSLREPHLLLAAARVDLALIRAGLDAHLALPPAREAHPDQRAFTWLAERHPGCPATDLDAAIHAAARHGGSCLDEADRLLRAAGRGAPGPRDRAGRPST